MSWKTIWSGLKNKQEEREHQVLMSLSMVSAKEGDSAMGDNCRADEASMGDLSL